MDKNQFALELYHTVDPLDSGNDVVRADNVLLGKFEDIHDCIRDKRNGPSHRMGDDKLIGQGNRSIRQAKSPAYVDDRNNPPLHVDDAEDDIRRLWQRGHINGANDPVDRPQMQRNSQVIQTKNNEI